MNDALYLAADTHFKEHLHLGLDALLAPIDAHAPCGRPARESRSYGQIAQERRHDDPSLPMGAWERDLKRADWLKVSHLIVQMLALQSKDLQLLQWLFEAQVKHHGIAGIAPALTLTREMCTRFWDPIHPFPHGGDYEHRANILRSIADKHLGVLRLAPLIQHAERSYGWADWERARYHAQVRVSRGRLDAAPEGATLDQLQTALADTPSDALAATHAELARALAALASLGASVDPLFGAEAPSLGKLADLLEQMRALFVGELHKRGIEPPGFAPATAAPAAQAQAASEAGGEPDAATDPASEPATDIAFAAAPGLAADVLRDRADAYARLAEIAAFLMRIEPHSPAPYLVRTATEWGRLSTPELYREVFLRLGGQLNIFEMLGIEAPNPGAAQ
ncbi:type VI secretion system protein TssA [Burkholderia sp. 3C]